MDDVNKKVLFLLLVPILSVINISQALHFLKNYNTFAQFPQWDACINSSISFEFKTILPEALLMYTDDNGNYDYVEVMIFNSKVRLRMNIVDGHERSIEMVVGERVDDNKWHRVEIKRNRMETTLFVDKFHDSRVAFGSDFYFGNASTGNNYVYFGGLPRRYGNKLEKLSLSSAWHEERFNGDIRNVIYGNCSCIPVRASLIDGKSIDNRTQEACEKNNNCGKCLCISEDEGPGCQCVGFDCPQDVNTYYHLPMDVIEGDQILNPSGLDAKFTGSPHIVPAVLYTGMKLDCSRQYIKVSGPGHRYECFGDLSLCPDGYTIGMWFKFDRLGTGKGVYLSNGGHSTRSHGVAMYYQSGSMEWVFRLKNGREWRAIALNVFGRRWYHVTVTWHKLRGVSIYLNGYKAAQGLTPTYRAPINSSISFDDFIIGQSNNHEETRDLGMMTVDDFQFWSYTLEETDLMEKGPIYHYHLSMDQLQNGYLVVPTLEPRTRGLLQQVPGIIGNAVEIPGRGQYIDLGSFTDTCLGNTTLCIYGFTVTFWVKFNRLQDNTYFMTSSVSGFSLFSYGNRLYANVQYGDRQYQATISGIETGVWYFLEITWNPSSGLELFKDQTLVASQTASNHYQVKSTNHDNFYIGRANTVMYTEKYAAITIDDLHLYNAGLELLLKIGFIQRGKPIKHYYGFDAMSGSRIEHPITDIQTEGNPSLVPGKINKALRLNGRSQSAYFDNGDGCLGNLDFCPHGVLLAFWFRPENSTEGMTYLSTGINGIEISNNGREFRTKVANSVYMWEVMTTMMEPNMWYYVEVTWSEEAGLHLFINNKDVVTDTKPSEIDSRIATSGVTDDMFVLGKGNKAGSVYGAATYDEMEFWYNTRGYLLAFGYIQRGKPEHFTIRMDKIIDDGKQLENDDFIVKIFGRPLLVPGKIDAALKLNGNTQFIDLGEHGDSCLGNLEECGFGLSIFFWAKIENYNYYMYLLSTGSAGIKMYYLHNYIFITIDNNRKSWRLSAPKVSQDEWHHFELSWHPEFGLSLFIDNDLIDHVTSISIPEVSATGSEHFYIGSPNTEDIRGQRFSYADMAIDQLEIWYGRREELLAFDYIVRDNIGYESFSMETATGDIIFHPKYRVTLEQGAELSPGKVGQGISLDGTGQFVDLGKHMDKCFANIDVCNHGLTVSFWLKPRSSRTDQYFFSTPTYSIYSEDGLLKAKFVTSGKVWNVTSGGIRLDKWNNVMVSWDPEVGVKLFVDDRLLNNSQEPTDVMLSDQPTAGKVYIGKSSDPSIQQTANIQADEIQIWYADIDRLTAHGKYKIPLREEIALSEMPSSGVLKLPSRTVTLKGGATVVSEKDGNSVRLNGRAQFIDMGENLTCAGDLDRCPLGFTMRFVIKPERVLNNMYFLDSYPVSVFYRDGNMYATIRTSTKTWSVGAPGLKTGEWQTVDISWHPEVGLTMFVNDKEVGAHKTHGIKIEPVYDYDRRTFFGRAMTNMRNERYADTSVRNFEVINTRRDVLVANNQLNDGDGINYPVRPTGPQIYTTSKPGGDDTKTRDTVVLTSNPQTGNGQSSFGSQAGRTLSSTTSKIIQFVGKSYVIYDLNVLTDDMLVAANEEEFSFQFVTKQADGLMWVFNSTDQKLYVGLKDSSLVFGYIVGQNRAQTFRIDHPDSRALNDLKWHTIKIVKNGRTLKFYVDGRYVQEIVTRNLIQFMRLGDVYIGGVTNPREFTGGIITEKFDGAITDVDSKKTVGPKREYVISFLQNIETAQTIGNILIFDRGSWNISLIESTRPPPVTPAPDLSTPITFTSGASALYLQEALDMRKSGSIGFKFRTLEPRGLLVFARGSSQGVTFFAIEIFDGNLYLVYDLGSLTSRKTFTDRRVDDGEWHEVLMKVQNGQLVLTLDRIQFVINLSRQDAERLYFYRVYIGGFNDFRYNSIPWSIYSRQGYKGCLETLKINNIGVDLQVEVRRSRPQYVELGCSSVSRSCQTQPCVSGACRDRMNGYVCDCANTPYTGDTCNEDAVIGGWDGSFATTYDFPIREMTHTNDISFRFRTLMKDTILFRSEADNGRDFIRVELINGKVQMTISVDGNTKTFSSGNNLNDDLWHTLYFRRRADDVELWVDDERPTVGLIGGENYQLQIDKIKFGAVGDTGALKTNNYIGYLQNFIYEDTDLFQLLKSQNPNHKWIIDLPYNKLPLLTYKPVTITTSDAFFQLPSLRMGITMKLMFKFKTRESNGLILYNAGSGRDVIAVELSDGQIRLAYNLGGQNMFTMVPSLKKFNDNKWHTVVVTLNERGQFILKVDSDTTTASTSDADGRLDLSGSLYVGGLPSEMFKRSSVTNLIVSRNGFRGCLASVDLNGSAPDLINYARDPSTVLNGCTDLAMVCQPDVCGTGTCMPGINNYWCNCNMTGYVGSSCTDWPVGYYFGRNGANGVMIYEFPFEKQSNSDVDEIAFGFMTREKDGVLYRIESSLNSNEFIEISLDDGFVKADSNTGNGLVSITQNSKRFNDGLYHVVRYVRTGTNSSLQVDTLPAQIIPHSGGVSVFNKVYRVILGGRTDDRGAIIRNYYGIMGGAYYNGNRWFDMLLAGKNLHGNLVKLRGDVTLTKPFVLVSGARKTTAAPPDIVIPPDEVIPEGIGGGGFVVGSISGGDGGGAGVIGIGGPGGSLTPVGGVSVAGGPGTPLAVAGVGPAPPALAGGARAGAVVGTLLGTLAFMSSLMWALYKLKPGVPAILSPGAGAAGGGAGMSISAPRATSNLGAVQAASGGAGGGGAGAGGGASKVTVVNGSAAGGGAGGGSSTYTSYFQSTSTNVQGGGAGGAGGAGSGSAMAGGHADAIDSSTLRATGYSSNYQSNAANYQSNTMQSYGSSMGGGTMDRGYGDRQFMSLSSAGGGDNIPDYDMPMPGTLQSQSGHNYSSSTLNTHYNYQVSGIYNPSYSHMTSVLSPPTTHTSVMSLILASGRNTPTPTHSVVYSGQLAPSRNQGFVDRSEDMVMEAPPPAMIVKPVKVKPNAHYKSEVTIQTGTLPSARFTANSSLSEGTSQSNKYMTLTTGSSGKVQSQQGRKSSLQTTSGTRGDFGYERLGSYSSETNIDSTVPTGLVSKKNKKQTTNYAESRDDLYESTMTVTSELRSDSVDNSLFSLTEESSGTNDMLFNSVDNFSLFNISSGTPDSRTYSDTYQSPSEPTYAKVNKQSNNTNKNTTNTTVHVTNESTGNSFEMVETNYNVTCTAQLKDQSDLGITSSNTDTLQTTSTDAMSLDNVLNVLESYGRDSITTGGSQTDRAEATIVVQPNQITRRTSVPSQTGNTGNISFQIENQTSSSAGSTNVANFTSSVSAMSKQTSEHQINQSETSSSSIFISESFSGAQGTSYEGNSVSDSHSNTIERSIDSLDRKGMSVSESHIGTVTMSVDLSDSNGMAVSESYSSTMVTSVDSLGRKGSSLEDELDQSVNDLLMGINVDTSHWTALKDGRPSSDTDTDVWEVQNYKTVTVNKQGQYMMTTAGGGAVTPGAAADEVRVDCCLMTSSGGSVVTGSSLGPPQVWDMQTGELQNIMKGDTVGSTNLHLVCGDRLLVGAVHADMEINEYSSRKGVFNHTLQIWDFQTGRPLSMAEGEYCSAMCPMSDSDKVLFGRTDKFGDATSIIAWDLMGNQMIKEMRYDAPVGNNDYISYLNKSKNDRYIIAGYTNSFDNNAEFMTFDMTLTSYNISEPAMLKLDANPECTAILPKDEAVTGLRNGDLVIWGIRAAQPSRQLMGGGGAHAHSREVKSVTLSEDGRYLVSTSADGTVKVWDMQTERPIHTLQGHSDEVWCSAISSDNEIVVSGSADGTIRLWRMKNGTEMCTFNCGVDIFYVTMSHDKGTIVALGDKYGARKLIMLQVVRTKIKKIVSS